MYRKLGAALSLFMFLFCSVYWNLTNCETKNGTFSALYLLNTQLIDVLFGAYCSVGKPMFLIFRNIA
jgi:hypothetical protein